MVSVERTTGRFPSALDTPELIVFGRQGQMVVFDGASLPGASGEAL